MKLTAKIAIILVCVSLCGTAALVLSKSPEKREPQRTNAIPVKNQTAPPRQRAIWA